MGGRVVSGIQPSEEQKALLLILVNKSRKANRLEPLKNWHHLEFQLDMKVFREDCLKMIAKLQFDLMNKSPSVVVQ